MLALGQISRGCWAGRGCFAAAGNTTQAGCMWAGAPLLMRSRWMGSMEGTLWV